MRIAKTTKQLLFYVMQGDEEIMLAEDFFYRMSTVDEVVEYIGISNKKHIKLYSYRGRLVNKNKVNKILESKIPNGVVRITVPRYSYEDEFYSKETDKNNYKFRQIYGSTKFLIEDKRSIKYISDKDKRSKQYKGEKNYKAWFAKLLTLQGFVMNKEKLSFTKEVRDDDFYSAGIIDYKDINYYGYTLKPKWDKLVVETKEVEAVIGNTAGQSIGYVIKGKSVFSKPIVEKTHLKFMIDGKIYTRKNIKYYRQSLIDTALKEEQEFADSHEIYDFFNDDQLSCYEKLCKISVNPEYTNNTLINTVVNGCNTILDTCVATLDELLDYIDKCREDKDYNELNKLNHKGLIEIVDYIYKTASKSLDDEYFGNSRYFEDIAFGEDKTTLNDDLEDDDILDDSEDDEYEYEDDLEDED